MSLSLRLQMRYNRIVGDFNALPMEMPDKSAAANRIVQIFQDCGATVFEHFERNGDRDCKGKMHHYMAMKSDMELCKRLFHAVGLRGY